MKILKSPTTKTPAPVSEWATLFKSYPDHVPGFKTAREIADETGACYETIRKKLAQMELMGTVETRMVSGAHRGKPCIAYKLKSNENKKP